MNEELGKLMALCVSLNAKDFNVFCDYSGHVEMINVRVIKGVWSEDSITTDLGYIKADERVSYIKDIANRLVAIHKAFRAEASS